jgi:hypothetical protein
MDPKFSLSVWCCFNMGRLKPRRLQLSMHIPHGKTFLWKPNMFKVMNHFVVKHPLCAATAPWQHHPMNPRARQQCSQTIASGLLGPSPHDSPPCPAAESRKGQNALGKMLLPGVGGDGPRRPEATIFECCCRAGGVYGVMVPGFRNDFLKTK